MCQYIFKTEVSFCVMLGVLISAKMDCVKNTQIQWLTNNTNIYIYIYIYTGCNRRNGPDFGRVFLRSNYTDITQNTYIQS